MKKLLALLIVVIAIVYLSTRFKSNDDEVLDNKTETPAKNGEAKTAADKVDPTPTTTMASAKKKLPATSAPVQDQVPKTEDEAIDHFVETLFINVNYEKNSTEVMADLDRLGLAPVSNVSSNPETGSLNIVRTNKTLPGTRYFHAQFFGDGDEQTLQHMSFEFKPGVNAFNKGVEILKKTFKITGKAMIDNPNMQAYPVENGYIAWVKKLTEEDLKDNPFNAYTKEDVGTIRVAIELDIHGGDGEEDHEH